MRCYVSTHEKMQLDDSLATEQFIITVSFNKVIQLLKPVLRTKKYEDITAPRLERNAHLLTSCCLIQ